MTPDETLLLRVAREIEEELSALSILPGELAGAPRGTGNSYSSRARASIIHDFYTGIERVFMRIAEELNGGIPRSEQWHRQLLADMTLDLPGVRPAVLSADLARSLSPFLRFRHLFRNLYGYVLDPLRIEALEADLPAAYDRFSREIGVFIAWMRRT